MTAAASDVCNSGGAWPRGVTNMDVFSLHRPPVSVRSTTGRQRRLPMSSGQVRSFLLLASCNAAPANRQARLRGCPSRVRAETRAVFLASGVPPHKVRPLGSGKDPNEVES